MRYRAYWDLTTIPDEALRAESMRRRSKERSLPVQLSAERREYLNRNKIAVRKYKEKRRAELEAQLRAQAEAAAAVSE